MVEKIIKSVEAGQTLEKYVRKILNEAPLSFIYHIFRKKDVKVNGHWQTNKFVLSENDVVRIYVTDQQLAEFQNNKKIEANDLVKSYIVYEDNNILLINKPRNLLVQPDSSNEKSLDKMVLEYLVASKQYESNDSAFTPGPAHRLDRNTSGLVLFGKNIKTLQYLFNVIKDRDQIAKRYITLVKGDIEKDGFVDLPLKKDERTGKVFVTNKSSGGKPAKTIYHVLERLGDYTLLDIVLVTGRTHQIRVHMAAINHPVVGDCKYGDFETNHYFENHYRFKNQFLHSYMISFGELEEPLKYLSKKAFQCEMPNEFKKILEDMKKPLN